MSETVLIAITTGSVAVLSAVVGAVGSLLAARVATRHQEVLDNRRRDADEFREFRASIVTVIEAARVWAATEQVWIFSLAQVPATDAAIKLLTELQDSESGRAHMEATKTIMAGLTQMVFTVPADPELTGQVAVIREAFSGFGKNAINPILESMRVRKAEPDFELILAATRFVHVIRDSFTALETRAAEIAQARKN